MRVALSKRALDSAVGILLGFLSRIRVLERFAGNETLEYSDG